MRLGDREALALRVNALVHPLDRLALDGRAVAAELGGHVLEVLEEVVDGAPLQNAIGRGVAGRRPDVVDLGLLDQELDQCASVLATLAQTKKALQKAKDRTNSAPAPPPPAGGPWTCSACTFENPDPSHVRCFVCMAPRS